MVIFVKAWCWFFATIFKPQNVKIFLNTCTSQIKAVYLHYN